MKTRSVFFGFIFFCLLISCVSSEHGRIDYEQGGAVNGHSGTVEAVPDSFGLNFQTISEIVQSATQFDLGSSPPVSAWKYVTDISQHGYPMNSEDWLSDPIIYINSIGWGFCDDVATVLAGIWTEMGYPSRVWFLSGHVVAEFQDSTGWHLMDPDKGAYFTTLDGKIASYEEILVEDAILNLNRANIFEKPSIGQQMGLYSDEVVGNTLKSLIRSTGNNVISDYKRHDITFKKSTFLIPSFSVINYYTISGGGAIKALIKVSVPSGSKGNLYVPLTCVIVEKTGDSAQTKMPFKDLVGAVFPKEGITFNGETTDTLEFWFLANGVQQIDYDWIAPVLPFKFFANRFSGNWVDRMLFASRISQTLTINELERIEKIEKSIGTIPCLERLDDLIRVYDKLSLTESQNITELKERREKLRNIVEALLQQTAEEEGESDPSDFDMIRCNTRAIAALIFLLTETSAGKD